MRGDHPRCTYEEPERKQRPLRFLERATGQPRDFSPAPVATRSGEPSMDPFEQH